MINRTTDERQLNFLSIPAYILVTNSALFDKGSAVNRRKQASCPALTNVKGSIVLFQQPFTTITFVVENKVNKFLLRVLQGKR